MPTVVQPGFINRGPKRGSEATSGGRVVGGGFPSHGRENFQNLCLKTAFSCTLDTCIRGTCSGIEQFPTLFIFYYFPNEFVSGKHFPFPFLSSFVLLSNQWGGGGGHGPLVHLSYSSNSGAAKICQRGQSEGAMEGVAGGNPLPPMVGRFFFSPNLCMKLAVLHIRYHY